jgi:hypothetical protein
MQVRPLALHHRLEEIKQLELAFLDMNGGLGRLAVNVSVLDDFGGLGCGRHSEPSV